MSVPSMAKFQESAKKTCGRFLNFMRVYGDNIAGIGWLAGSLEQIGFGVWDMSPRQLASGAVNMAASAGMIAFGHKDLGVRVCCVLGQTGTTLTLWPDLASGDLKTIGVYTIGTGIKLFGLFSPELTKTFESSNNFIYRNILGSPRRTAMINAAIDLFLVFGNPHHIPAPEVSIPYVTWGLAYIASSASKSQQSRLRQNAPAPK